MPKYYLFFNLLMILKGPENGTPQAVLKIQVCLFFLEQICTLRSFDSEYAHGPQEVFKSFEIHVLNQNLPQRIFQMWSDTDSHQFSSNGSRAENRTCMCFTHDRPL